MLYQLRYRALELKLDNNIQIAPHPKGREASGAIQI